MSLFASKEFSILNEDEVFDESISVNINTSSKYIISTSGRISSCERYKKLLSSLKLNINYIPINSLNSGNKIDPIEYCYILRGLPCIGGAISKDIKQSIVPHLDYIDPSARKYNAINTVLRVQPGQRIINTSTINDMAVQDKGDIDKNETNNIVHSDLVSCHTAASILDSNIKMLNDTTSDILVGYNTDVLGFQYAISNCVAQRGVTIRTAVCYGYGGVTNVAVKVLQSMGVFVYITGRNPISVEAKALELGAGVYKEHIAVDLFVNATPVTDKPLQLASGFLETIQCCQCKVVFDHELQGQYLKTYCADHSIMHISGTDMYQPQMHIQWTLFLYNYIQHKNRNIDKGENGNAIESQAIDVDFDVEKMEYVRNLFKSIE